MYSMQHTPVKAARRQLTYFVQCACVLFGVQVAQVFHQYIILVHASLPCPVCRTNRSRSYRRQLTYVVQCACVLSSIQVRQVTRSPRRQLHICRAMRMRVGQYVGHTSLPSIKHFSSRVATMSSMQNKSVTFCTQATYLCCAMRMRVDQYAGHTSLPPI